MTTIDKFSKYLRSQGMADSTVKSYTYALRLYLARYKPKPDTDSLLAFKGWLVDTCSPRTANLRLNGINAWLVYIGHPELRLKTIRIQHRPYLDKVICDSDYRKLKRRLKADNRLMLHYAVWTMAATGARISELLRLRPEHYRQGYIDIIGKGGKLRRIYIPKTLCADIDPWLPSEGIVYTNAKGKPITARGLAREIQRCAERYGIDPSEAHPHAFRHRFALNFLAKHKDLALLADLLGHASIETTRIYLRRTATEQAALINRLVDW